MSFWKSMILLAMAAAAWVMADEPGPRAGADGRWAGEWASELATAADADADAETPIEGEAVEDFAVAALFAREPAGFLVDAGGLLSPQAARERLDFLAHHAEDSRINVFVVVLDPAWRVPADLAVGDWISGKDAVVVLFPLGEPQRAGFFLPRQLAERVSDAEQRRALQSSVMQAVGKEDAAEQLEAFLSQISIRLYWMEEMLESESAPVVVPPALPPGDDAGDTAQAEFPVPVDWWPWLAAMAVCAVLAPLAWWVHRARTTYRFPEFEVEPRLGGPHAAGVGAVISYLSPNVPPAEQRDQMPDYPHRP